MSRYEPTPDERNALIARGWRMDEGGWWFHYPPRTEYGLTYREAVKQANREERNVERMKTTMAVDDYPFGGGY